MRDIALEVQGIGQGTCLALRKATWQIKAGAFADWSERIGNIARTYFLSLFPTFCLPFAHHVPGPIPFAWF
jgi:hypothetical protein